MERLKSITPHITTLDLRRGGPVTQRIVGRELTRIRERIILRDGAACVKCGKGVGPLEVDHVVPLHVGGSNDPANLELLCRDCHRVKTELEGRARQ